MLRNLKKVREFLSLRKLNVLLDPQRLNNWIIEIRRINNFAFVTDRYI